MADESFERLSSNTHEAWTLFAVRFHDKPGNAELRKQLLPAHLEWVEQGAAGDGEFLRHASVAAPTGERARDDG